MTRSNTLITLVCVALLLGGGYFLRNTHYRKTDGFTISAVQFEVPPHVEWDVPSPKENDLEVLRQPFTYLSKGARSYAFLSEDGQYVLKLFKYRYHQPHWVVRYLPSFFPFNYFREKKLHKVSLETVLSGYKIAYDADPEGTGLLYIHLNTTDRKFPSVVLTDKTGKKHAVDLSNTRFVLQRRARELSTILQELLNRGETAQASRRINQVFDLYLTHFEKGVYDLGMGFIRNNGFIEDRPVHFDVGKMTKDDRVQDPTFHLAVFTGMAKKIALWVKSKYPEHYAAIVIALEEKLRAIYKTKISIAEVFPDEAVRIALAQPYTYLDEGGQSSVYSSADGQYVLKLVKFHRFEPRWYIRLFPDWGWFARYKERHASKKTAKLKAVIDGHRIAFDHHRKGSGLVYVQLAPTSYEAPILLFGKDGKKRQIDLGKTVFILQNRGKMLNEELSGLLGENKVGLAKQRIGSVLSLYLKEYGKGIYDLDHGVMHNIGFIGEEAFHLDAGKFAEDERMRSKEFYEPDLIKVFNKIRAWIESNFPHHYQEIAEDIDRRLEGIRAPSFLTDQRDEANSA